MTKESASKLPLFFNNPVILSSNAHKDWRVREGDFSFAAKAISAPVTVSEFYPVSRDYPILFAGEAAAPIALMGLKDRNLSVNNGEWAQGHYLPAYIRRYPFGTVTVKEREAPVLLIDAECERVLPNGDEEVGVALFENDQPSQYTQRIVSFCEKFHGDALRTEAFSKALVEADLLVDQHADIRFPGESENFKIGGFRIVDQKRFAELPNETVIEWHRNNWLGLLHLHFASMDRFKVLMSRQSA